MNLHGIVSGAIGAVNPFVASSVQVSDGTYTTAGDGKRTPNYTTVTGRAQVQALTGKDLRQLDGINLNGTERAIYFYGKFDGVVRPSQKGGDIVTLMDGPNAGTWLITLVLEQWPDWVKVAVTLQNE